MNNLFKILSLIIFVSACSFSPSQTKQSLIQKSLPLGFSEKDYQTKNFKILSLQKLTNKNSPINVYIEGDGRAWLSRTVVSPNPTPRNLLLANFALKDKAPNVIYFARPCQFVDDDKCEKKYWTTHRFSKPVIESYKEVLSQFNNQEVNLIGYSGGAAVAILLASRMDNVKSIKTIAGNLDYNAFTEYHKVTPLNDDMDIDAAIAKISSIPQTHYLGAEDKVVTKEVFESFKSKIKNPKENLKNIKFITVPNATHSKGWEGLQW